MYCLQSRWKIEGRSLYYYGLRNKLFSNRVKISKKQLAVLSALPGELTGREKRILGKLLGEQVVTEEKVRKTPASLSEARFCAACCANDFILPGLEFDEAGRCPMCRTAEKTQKLKSVLPLIDEIPRSEKSRFDIALL